MKKATQMKSRVVHRYHVGLLRSAGLLLLAGLFVLSACEQTSAQSADCVSHENRTDAADCIQEPQDRTSVEQTDDSDSDGLLDMDEFENGTDPHSVDSDSDGLPDLWEVEAGLDATDAEDTNGAQGNPDGDGYTNLEEYNNLTDPLAPDGLMDNAAPESGSHPVNSDEHSQQTDPFAFPPMHLLLPFILP